MLNAEGGTIWIGIEDDKEGAAGAVEPVAEPEREKRRLLDYLVEAVEPTPIEDEVVIEVHALGAGDRGLLAIRVRPSGADSGRVPAAFLRKGGRHYVRRIDARNHQMTRAEVFRRETPLGDRAMDEAHRELVAARTAFRDAGEDGLWMGFRTVRRIQLETQLNRERLHQIAYDPSLSGNRRTGRHFAQSRHPALLTKDGVRWEDWSDEGGRRVSSVEVRDDGTLQFSASKRILLRGEPEEISPWRLLEYPISAFRIARVIYQGLLVPSDSVLADLALFGVGGCKLRPGTPVDQFFHLNDPVEWPESDLVWDPARVFSFEEIDTAPDRCGFQLVRRVYQAFGFRQEDVPREYDRETARLVLPE